jgi:predicted DCC family thiol-disulfide oxidoreductase YuxK
MDARLPVLIYDGSCRFCVREAARLARWARGRVRLESFRDPGVVERYPGLTQQQCDQALQLIEPDGRIRSGAEAVAHTLRLNPRIAPLTYIYNVPVLRSAFDLGYRLVARNRFALGGEVCTDATCGVHQPREPPPGRTHVRDLFLRLLGLTFLIAFLSLLAQVDVLYGSHGLLPMQPYLDAWRPVATWLSAPTLLWLSCSDTALRLILAAGALLSLVLIFNVAPLYCLVAAWLLYVSFASVGRTFLEFQWDNLLLEAAFFSFFITPAGLRPKGVRPHPVGIFLMQWLLFRLHVESGAAKLLRGDPTWRDLTAMVSYYETAPIPTWLGWYVHQLPLWAHEACAVFTLFVELIVPFFIWGPRALRVGAFFFMIAMQLSVVLTANYGFFNYLSMALCLFVLDDGHLGWVTRRLGWVLSPVSPRAFPRWQTFIWSVVAIVLVPLSVIQFAPFVRPLAGLDRDITPARTLIAPFRSLNIYHLFATMTLVRREVVIEGSNDGTTWLPYEFRYKPGDVDRRPPFVAPHQPRVDFQLWFLLLRGGPPLDLYFNNLLARLLHAPQAVAPLFSRDPFPDAPPQFIRLAYYRYHFTDWATRRATKAWWRRDLLGYSKPITAEMVRAQ